ncbi:hypothetical protein Tco_1259316 [Tanacetum coccineum]
MTRNTAKSHTNELKAISLKVLQLLAQNLRLSHEVPGAYSNGVINNKAALERQHINVVEADIRHNLVQSTGPDDLFSLNNGHLTTSFLDSLPTATRENVQKAM